jgi:hypothetical protein
MRNCKKNGHLEMPIARQVSSPGNKGMLFLNQENTIADIHRYSHTGWGSMAHGIFHQCGRKIVRLKCYW